MSVIEASKQRSPENNDMKNVSRDPPWYMSSDRVNSKNIIVSHCQVYVTVLLYNSIAKNIIIEFYLLLMQLVLRNFVLTMSHTHLSQLGKALAWTDSGMILSCNGVEAHCYVVQYEIVG